MSPCAESCSRAARSSAFMLAGDTPGATKGLSTPAASHPAADSIRRHIPRLLTGDEPSPSMSMLSSDMEFPAICGGSFKF